ncbi:MAG: methyl-accepting chemotaxis protein, partial [bacterium]|nr:methyl-accepting chemotaxis protein [bacterium]
AGEKEKAAAITTGKGALHVKDLNDAVQSFLDFANGKAKTFVQNAELTSSKAVIINYSISGIVLLISIILSVVINRSITLPIALVVDVSEAMAGGDMTRRLQMDQIDEGGKLSNSLDALADALENKLTEVSLVSEQLATAASQLSNSSDSLSKGAGEQAATLEEISSTMIEIEAQTKSNAENSSKMNQILINVKETGDTGMEEMENMKAAMQEIVKASKSI